MKTLHSSAAPAALLLMVLAGCAPTASTGTPDAPDSSDSGSGSGGDSDAGFVGATLPGSGDYVVPDQAPYGGYELPDYQDGLPDGCTWQTYDKNGTLFGDSETNGQFIFITDVHVRFVTDGCPDWVQFEEG